MTTADIAAIAALVAVFGGLFYMLASSIEINAKIQAEIDEIEARINRRAKP